MFTVFLFYKEKELSTGEGCVEMDIPWQLCRTIGPLLSQKFSLASAKAQPRGGFFMFNEHRTLLVTTAKSDVIYPPRGDAANWKGWRRPQKVALKSA